MKDYEELYKEEIAKVRLPANMEREIQNIFSRFQKSLSGAGVNTNIVNHEDINNIINQMKDRIRSVAASVVKPEEQPRKTYDNPVYNEGGVHNYLVWSLQQGNISVEDLEAKKMPKEMKDKINKVYKDKNISYIRNLDDIIRGAIRSYLAHQSRTKKKQQR